MYHLWQPKMGKRFREKCSKKLFEKSIFRIFLAALAPNMHKTECRGARDLRAVKISAPYDAWRTKKLQKTKTQKNIAKYDVFHCFCWFFEELQIFGPQQMIPVVILL